MVFILAAQANIPLISNEDFTIYMHVHYQLYNLQISHSADLIL